MRPHFPHPASSLFRPIPRDTTLRDRYPQSQREGTSHRGNKYCDTCDKVHPGDCWPICRDCKRRHSPRYTCRRNQDNWQQDRRQHELQAGLEYLPIITPKEKNQATTQATENVFRYGMNATSVKLAEITELGLTRDSWIFDTGASFHTCNNWNLMEDVVKGEPQTTIASNGEKQSGDLFGKVKVAPPCPSFVARAAASNVNPRTRLSHVT
jgi:hypothetical protein